MLARARSSCGPGRQQPPRARRLLFGSLLGAVLSLPAAALTPTGWVEEVVVLPEGIDLLAKIDTGAAHSSIDVRSLRRFFRDGRELVVFRIERRDAVSVPLERPLIRIARIKRHFGRVQERPVVELRLCLGGVVRATEVNLVDRGGFTHSMLIGRSFLSGEFIVDPSKTHLLDGARERCRRDARIEKQPLSR